MDIRTAIAKKILKVKIQPFKGTNLLLEQKAVGTARHRVLGQFALPGGGSEPRPASGAPPAGRSREGERNEASPQNVTIRRSVPKVGRNDPCPCGSGKKYKYCHGR